MLQFCFVLTLSQLASPLGFQKTLCTFTEERLKTRFWVLSIVIVTWVGITAFIVS